MSFAQLKHASAYVAVKEFKKAALRKLALPKYLGDRFSCPVCGTRLQSFKPIWKSFMRLIDSQHSYPFKSLQTFNWQAYSCPACDASDRERLYALYFDRISLQLDPRRRYRLVEFAPSRALRHKLSRNPIFEYRSADLHRKSVDDQIDIADMHQYQSESFDIFICSHVLEHVPDDQKALRELFRILRRDGMGIVMVPLIASVDRTVQDSSIDTRDWRASHYGDSDHVRQYGVQDFQNQLRSVGFQLDLLDKNFFGPDTYRKAGIAEDSVLYVVKKSTGDKPRDAEAKLIARA